MENDENRYNVGQRIQIENRHFFKKNIIEGIITGISILLHDDLNSEFEEYVLKVKLKSNKIITVYSEWSPFQKYRLIDDSQ